MNQASGVPGDVQDSFLLALLQSHVLVEVILVNGETRIGSVRRFDRFAIVLEISGREELIYKHAVACIHPEAAVRAPAVTRS